MLLEVLPLVMLLLVTKVVPQVVVHLPAVVHLVPVLLDLVTDPLQVPALVPTTVVLLLVHPNLALVFATALSLV